MLITCCAAVVDAIEVTPVMLLGKDLWFQILMRSWVVPLQKKKVLMHLCIEQRESCSLQLEL